ncbi:hypothetical protein [Yersinia kristensenii]|uniref:hypothetical protein n=1 Tax=Yersinia kristensenii TaxID=28152 RepID=UPI0012D3D4DF|nr:hypothetical protein [Yersinia kristensenii]
MTQHLTLADGQWPSPLSTNDAPSFRRVGCVHARQPLSVLSPDKFFRGGLLVAPTPG